MSDGFIKIETLVDQTGLDKGLKGVDDKLKTTEKTTDSTAKSFASLGLKVAAAGAAVKVVTDIVNDLTSAYKTQIKAETQLESAAKNNPLLDSSSVQALKDYASEIQSLSTFGDEELLPMFASLAAAGRSQDQIMQIMTVATDMAASGAFSLEGAVKNLNRSFGGLSGELGEAIPEIKSLSAEQLKNGGVVDLLAGRYKGIAAEVAKTTGTAEQLGNAFGDLKEELGAPFEKAAGPVRTFFTNLLSGMSEYLKKKREMEEGDLAIQNGTAEISQLETKLVLEKQKFDVLKSEASAEISLGKEVLKLSDADIRKRGTTRDIVKSYIKNYEDQLLKQENIVNNLDRQIRVGKAVEQQTKDRTLALNEEERRLREAAEYIAANIAAREKALEQLELQAKTEERAVTAEEKLSVYAGSYVSLVSESNGLITVQNQAAVSLLNTTIEIGNEVEAQNDAKEKAIELEQQLKGVLDSIQAIDPRKESEKMRDQLAVLDDYYNQVQANATISTEDKLKLEEEYLEKRKVLLGLEADAAKEEAEQEKQAHREKTIKILSIANDYASRYADIVNSITSMAATQIENEVLLKTDALKKEYALGSMSAEEYEKKLTDIKRDAAEEKYKIDMWIWGSQLLSAAANTALGIAQTLADVTLPTFARIALGAAIGAAGAAQVAAIVAYKPLPPTFSTGGVMGGTSYTGDKNLALMNSKERVLTAQQNAAFERLAYGGGGIGDIKIYNTASKEVTAKPQITADGVKIMIEKTVNQQMADGRFNRSYRTMQNNIRGTRYTN